MDAAAKIEACACAAHETNRVYCLALGDASQPHWEDAPEWQRESARKGVLGALAGISPEKSHENWRDEKILTGWQWGPVKDTDRREHPCMVAYERLPAEQRAKDALYLAVVRATAAAVGLHTLEGWSDFQPASHPPR